MTFFFHRLRVYYLCTCSEGARTLNCDFDIVYINIYIYIYSSKVLFISFCQRSYSLYLFHCLLSFQLYRQSAFFCALCSFHRVRKSGKHQMHTVFQTGKNRFKLSQLFFVFVFYCRFNWNVCAVHEPECWMKIEKLKQTNKTQQTKKKNKYENQLATGS